MNTQDLPDVLADILNEYQEEVLYSLQVQSVKPESYLAGRTRAAVSRIYDLYAELLAEQEDEAKRNAAEEFDKFLDDAQERHDAALGNLQSDIRLRWPIPSPEFEAGWVAALEEFWFNMKAE